MVNSTRWTWLLALFTMLGCGGTVENPSQKGGASGSGGYEAGAGGSSGTGPISGSGGEDAGTAGWARGGPPVHGDAGVEAGPPYGVEWDGHCECKNWTGPDDYPSAFYTAFRSCVTEEPCEDGEVCCAMSCVSRRDVCWYLGVSDIRCHQMGLDAPYSPYCCAHYSQDTYVMCVKKEYCAPEGVLEFLPDWKFDPDEKRRDLCIPNKH